MRPRGDMERLVGERSKESNQTCRKDWNRDRISALKVANEEYRFSNGKLVCIIEKFPLAPGCYRLDAGLLTGPDVADFMIWLARTMVTSTGLDIGSICMKAGSWLILHSRKNINSRNRRVRRLDNKWCKIMTVDQQ